ncbi:DUF4365 domain-containing protein [Algoriphagus aquimarinus]|uniref:DUF4365 domain-containing protein n=1 Tax=Algoriphagus aquimarinus TaxID=237018 RepID=A0A1I0YVP7_9BACT|nr:DUF4365 and DUF1817 domain-containing protein [Algoriphagus aquimarinus]SFB17331.1 hypothetical protein SAMN04489723_10586 [Algoriphagus aquimarinus]
MDLPKSNKSNKIGRKGVTLLTSIIEDQLDWQLRINHQEDDFGIDAYIDIITEDGHLTGKSIAVQIKSGRSYFKQTNEYGWNYSGELKHLNYYLNHQIPVILVIVDTDSKKAYWELCDAQQTDRSSKGWSIVIPFHQELGEKSKVELTKYIGPTIDYVSQLENQWKTNEFLKKIGHILLVVGKEEIENSDYEPLISALKYFTRKKDLMYKYRSKIEIAIHGYDNDDRQLYEIDKPKEWIVNILEHVKGLTFFLANHVNAQFLRLFLYSQIEFEIKGNPKNENGIEKIKVEFESKESVKVLYKLFDDLNEFCDYFKIPTPINKEVSDNITNCYTGGEFLKNKDNQ